MLRQQIPNLSLVLPFLLSLLLPTPRTLHLFHSSTHSFEQLPKPKAPPLDPHAPHEKIHQRPVTDAKRQEDAKVSPFVARADVDRGEVVVAHGVGTVVARRVCLGIE